MTVRAMDDAARIATLAGNREVVQDWAAHLRRRGGTLDDAMARRLMLDLEDLGRDLDDVIGNLRMTRQAPTG